MADESAAPVGGLRDLKERSAFCVSLSLHRVELGRPGLASPTSLLDVHAPVPGMLYG